MFRPTNKSSPAEPSPPVVVSQPQPQVIQPSEPGGPQQSYTPAPNTAPDQPYNFITNPELPPKQPLMGRLPGGNSIAIRVGVVAVGLIILLILFSVIKGVLSSGPDLTSLFTSVIQDQQELIHLSTNALAEPDLSTGNKNLASTMQTAITTSQTKTAGYLTASHKKVNPKTLNLKVSKSTDDQLTAAEAATTYNQTFQQVIQAKLNTYAKDIQQAYKQDKGKKGRALLNDNYRQIQLFQVQLAAAANG